MKVTEEMRQAVRAAECSAHGHSFDTVTTFVGEPVRLLCTRCGRSWAVAAGQP